MKWLLTLSLLSSFLFSTLYTNAQEEIKVKTKDDKTKVKGKGINNDINKNTTPGSSEMQGAYSLVKQILNDGTKDSLIENKQFKIYTDRYMMYAHSLPGDSLGDYGIGTYKLVNGKVTEYVFYTGSGGAHKDTFQVDIKKMPEGYSQVINFPVDSQGKKFVLTEDYRNVGKSVSSPLDGAWKQTKMIWTPKDSATVTENNPTEFKIYQSGHFIWANTTKDSAGKPASAYGYGSFKMNGDNKATELNIQSTYNSDLVNIPIGLQIEFMGKDAFKQTIIFPGGEKYIGFYQRLK